MHVHILDRFLLVCMEGLRNLPQLIAANGLGTGEQLCHVSGYKKPESADLVSPSALSISGN